MRVYFAASLFSQAERSWNRLLAGAMVRAMPDFEPILPQDFKVAGKYNDPRHYGPLFRMCLEGLDSADAVLAVLDGPDADAGTAWEMGYACARGTPIIGIRTDFRPGAELGVNVMLSRSCRRLIREFSFLEDVDDLARRVARRLRKLRLDRRQAAKE